MSQDTYFTIDLGVNYADKKMTESQIQQILKNAYNLGVDKVVSISNNIKEAMRNIQLAGNIEMLHYVIGCHPHSARSFRGQIDIDFLEKNLNNPKCVAIGECGLDYFRDFCPHDIQQTVFKAQVALAKKHNKPLYIHCRDAFDDVKAILEDANYFNGFIHCFTGNLEQAIYFVGKGFKLGMTGFICNPKRNQETMHAIKDQRIKIEDLLVETDAPWMAIRPKRESHPEDTALVVEQLAKWKGIDEIECGKLLYKNARTFLGI